MSAFALLFHSVRRVGSHWLSAALLLVALHAHAQQPATVLPNQDVLLDLQGNELPGQVLEVTPTQVVYRPAGSDVALPPTVLDKRTLFMVRYANGTKETFGVSTPVANPAPTGAYPPASGAPMVGLSEADLYRQGRVDALRLHRYGGAFWGTYAATVLTFYGGPIVGVVVGASRPHAANNPAVSSQMLQSRAYVQGYETQAQRRKIGQAAAGFGAGLGTLLVLVALLVGSAN